MPVDLGVVEDVAARVAAVYREGETALATLITRRLAAGLDAPGWAVRKLAEINALRRDATAIADRMTARGESALRQAVADAYRAGNADAVGELADLFAGGRASKPHVPGGVRAANPKAVQALADAAVAELRPVHAAILPQVDNAYRRAVAGATARVHTGAATVREAAQAAWAALVDQGITSYIDKAGRRWSLDSYVAMAVRTAAHRAGIQALVDTFTAAGQRLVTVPDRPRECRLCRPWEHEVLALWGPAGDQLVGRGRYGEQVRVHVKATLAEARLAGLFHPNCRHTLRPYVEGETRTHYQTADILGERAEQRQRALERHLRRWRLREATALTTAGQTEARRRVTAWDAALTRHLDEHPQLTRQRFREHPGIGHTGFRRGRAHLPTGRSA